MFGYKYKSSLSDYEIEQKARALGMIYESEQKSMVKGANQK